MGPYDYSSAITNPLAMALQGYQMGVQIKQQRQAEDEKAAQRAAAQAKANAMGSLMRPGTTFADYQRVMGMFPDEAKELTAQWTAMDKVKQGAFFNAGGDAYALLTPGADGKIDATGAISKLESYATAAENGGDKETAQRLRDFAKAASLDPSAARAAIGMQMSVVDGERFKGLAAAELGPIDTAAVKNLIAEGLKPGSPEFQTAMRQEREKVTITLPGGGFYSGSPDGLRNILGTIPPEAQRGSLPRPKDKAEFDALPPGAVFIDPNGVQRTKPSKGGPVSNAPGGFRAGS